LPGAQNQLFQEQSVVFVPHGQLWLLRVGHHELDDLLLEKPLDGHHIFHILVNVRECRLNFGMLDLSNGASRGECLCRVDFPRVDRVGEHHQRCQVRIAELSLVLGDLCLQYVRDALRQVRQAREVGGEPGDYCGWDVDLARDARVERAIAVGLG
jgi:hypothetical protein